MNPEVLFFGCYGSPGHGLNSPRTGYLRYDSTPWGNKLDGGLLTDDYYKEAHKGVLGAVKVHHKDGWTAIAFWDRSGDSRGGSNTAFLVAAHMTGEELFELARQQWAKVCTRPNFPELKFPPHETTTVA